MFPNFFFQFSLLNCRLPKHHVNLIIKGGITTFYENALKEYQRLTAKLATIQKQLSTLPEGKLFCTTQNKYAKWYVTTKDGCHYIPKKDKVFAMKLAQKKLLLKQQKDYTHEKNALDFYLRHHKPYSWHKLFTEAPEYQDLLREAFTPPRQELAEWANSPYPKNLSYPEQLQYKSSSGLFVRSKSESMIALFLQMYKIPFRYECALTFDNATIYPDFTIRHPATGAFIYWEHFGLMDDPLYQKNTISKLQLYTSNGIIPSIHLITTFETKDHPLSPETIENIIKLHFT